MNTRGPETGDYLELSCARAANFCSQPAGTARKQTNEAHSSGSSRFPAVKVNESNKIRRAANNNPRTIKSRIIIAACRVLFAKFCRRETHLRKSLSLLPPRGWLIAAREKLAANKCAKSRARETWSLRGREKKRSERNSRPREWSSRRGIFPLSLFLQLLVLRERASARFQFDSMRFPPGRLPSRNFLDAPPLYLIWWRVWVFS